MNYHERKQAYKRKKRKRNSLIAITLFLIILPLIAVLYQPYLYYIKDPQIVDSVLTEAKTVEHSDISSNKDYIESMQNKVEASTHSKESEVDTASQIEQPNDYIYSLENEKAKEVYEETGITYDFEQVDFISAIPEDVTLNRNLLRGQILMPDVEMNLPIVEGVSNENLYTGASTMKPDQEMGVGNYALAGHLVPSQDLLFSPLKRAEQGMNIYVSNMDQVYTYTVARTFEVDPTSIEVISDEQGDGLLTLVTCSNLEGDGRLIVQAELTNQQHINEIDQDLYNQFME